MKILEEITDWEYTNGIYFVLDSGQLAAYASPAGDLKVFTVPLNFDRRGRKFITHANIPEEDQQGIAVKGSKGDVYYVHDGQCSCPGFKFRGQCKHVAQTLGSLEGLR